LFHDRTKVWTDVGGKKEPIDNDVPLNTLTREIAEEIFNNDMTVTTKFLEDSIVSEPIYFSRPKSYCYYINCPTKPNINLSFEKTHSTYEWKSMQWLATHADNKTICNYRLSLATKHHPRIKFNSSVPLENIRTDFKFDQLTHGLMVGQNLGDRTIVLTEKFNRHRLDILNMLKLVDDDIIRNSLCAYAQNQGQAEFGSYSIEYTDPGIGRLNSAHHIEEDKDNKGIVDVKYRQCIMKNLAKGSICNGIYYDLDVVNCHPRILLQLFELHKLPLYHTSILVNNRDKLFDTIMQSTGTNKDTVKTLVFNCIYGGETATWCKHNNVDIKLIPTEFLRVTKEISQNGIKLIDIYEESCGFKRIAIERKGDFYYNTSCRQAGICPNTCAVSSFQAF